MTNRLKLSYGVIMMFELVDIDDGCKGSSCLDAETTKTAGFMYVEKRQRYKGGSLAVHRQPRWREVGRRWTTSVRTDRPNRNTEYCRPQSRQSRGKVAQVDPETSAEREWLKFDAENNASARRRGGRRTRCEACWGALVALKTWKASDASWLLL